MSKSELHELADMLALRAVRREFVRRYRNGVTTVAREAYRKVYEKEYARVIKSDAATAAA